MNYSIVFTNIAHLKKIIKFIIVTVFGINSLQSLFVITVERLECMFQRFVNVTEYLQCTSTK